MVIPLAPKSLNSSDPCLALDEYNRLAGTLSDEQYYGSLAVVAIFCTICTIVLGMVLWIRDQLEQYGRSANITAFHIVSLAIGFSMFGLRGVITSISCQLHGFMLIVYISLSFTAYITRTLREWNRAEFAYTAIRYDVGILGTNDEVSTVDGSSSLYDEQRDRQPGIVKVLLILWSIFTSKGKASENSIVAPLTPQLTTQTQKEAPSQGSEERKLRLYAYMDKPYAAASLFVTLFMPGFMSLISLYLIAEIYYSYDPRGDGCRNCDIYLELWAIMTVIGLAYSIVLSRSMWRMKGKPDPNNNIKEIKHTMIICGTIHVVTWIIQLVDPGQASYYRSFQWVWLHQIVMCINLVLVAVLPVVEARRKHRQRLEQQWQKERQASIASIKFDEVFTNPAMAQKFEKFAESRFAAESYRFIVDVFTWKRLYFEKSPDIIRRKAKLLYDRYVAPGALLEVNIDALSKAATRKRILNEAGELLPEVPREAFDIAINQTKKMMEFGVWFDFTKIMRAALLDARTHPEGVTAGVL